MASENTNSTALGERLIRTLANVEFGHNRPPDEPAPEHVVKLYHAWKPIETELLEARLTGRYPEKDIGGIEYHAWRALVQSMKNHRSSCYIVDGVRLEWYTEPHGCRREYLKIEEVKP